MLAQDLATPTSDTSGAVALGVTLLISGTLVMLACMTFLRMRRRAIPVTTPLSERGRLWNSLALAHGLSYGTDVPLFPDSDSSAPLRDGVFGSWKGFPIRAGDDPANEETVVAARCGDGLGAAQVKRARTWLSKELPVATLEISGEWLVVRAANRGGDELSGLLDAAVGCVLHLSAKKPA